MYSIEFNNVWKSFRRGERARTVRDAIPNLFRFATGKQVDKSTDQTFWALKDVSFKIKRGEILGIIGPNGAGKTTILNLLAGLMRPNKGSVKVNGRISALIAIGAGFKSELTGRENIYLNGAIMGMKKREIDRKFDEIVEFAGYNLPEFKRFIDTPVKRYSSGMYVRLGFAVASHINADILLVDEVLAVGDMNFRRKCLNRIQELRDNQTTIVFVSHNLHAVDGLCNQAIFLNNGKIITRGETSGVIQSYQSYGGEGQKISLQKGFISPETVSSNEIKITGVQFFDKKHNKKKTFFTMEKMIVRVEYFSPTKLKNPIFNIGIYNPEQSIYCCVERSKYHNISIDKIEGKGSFEIEFDPIQLSKGTYLFMVSIFDSTMTLPYAYRRQDVFRVESYMPQIQPGKEVGMFHPKIKWEVR